MILYIKHIDIEGPETIAPFFEKHGRKSKTIELYKGEPLPKDVSGIDAVICLGGPMNVYEEDKYPFLIEEDIFIKHVLQHEIPYLGICLGSQLLCKAAGGKVTRSPVEEIGWSTVQLTDAGKKDPLFHGLHSHLTVYQWHGDTFSIPADGHWLVEGKDCIHQALRVGKNAYGLQFHIEITDKSIREWSDAYFPDPQELTTRKSHMLADYQKNRAVFQKDAETIYNNFLKIIRGSKG